jgi:hypothetical protein
LSKFLRISFKSNAKPVAVQTFEQSGYTLCNAIGGIRLIMDHGRLGMSPSCGHGHADCLSLLISNGDKEVITDCGTFGYATNPEWRKYFRGTSAHNTISVDGHDQAGYVNSFMWKDAYEAKLLFREEVDGGVYLLACHNGYESIGVTHWRGVFVDYQHGCFVWDALSGKSNHSLILRWHLAEVPCQNGNKFLINNKDSMELSIHNADEIKVSTGNLNPILGWKSNGYGERSQISTIEASYHGKLPHEFNTYISWGGNSIMENNTIDLAVEKFREIISDS